jgi:hypothetical protein
MFTRPILFSSFYVVIYVRRNMIYIGDIIFIKICFCSFHARSAGPFRQGDVFL